MKNIVIKNIKNGRNYTVDYVVARTEINGNLEGNDKEQCLKILDSIEKRNLALVFGYSAFVKYGCGHWGHLQLSHADDATHRPNDRCTKCICGKSWKRAGLSID